MSYDNSDDPNVGGGTGPVSNPQPTGGGGHWQVLLAYQLNVTQPCRVQALANTKQSHAGNGNWAVRLLIDDSVVDDAWGQAPLDKINLLGSAVIQSGAHSIQFQWQAATNVTVYRPRMAISWSYK